MTSTFTACGADSLGGITPPDDPSLVVIPGKGSATTLDVAGWNIEWFGSTGGGPTNRSHHLPPGHDPRRVIHAGVRPGRSLLVATGRWAPGRTIVPSEFLEVRVVVAPPKLIGR